MIRRPLPAATMVFTFAGVAAVALYFLLDGLASDVIYATLAAATGITILFAASKKERGRGAWIMLGIGTLCWAAGDIVWSSYEFVLHRPAPYPSLADVIYLCGYAFLLSGVLMYLGRHRRTLRRYVLLDVAIVALPIGLIAWRFFVSHYVGDFGAGWFVHVVGLGGHILDLALVGAAGALVLAPRPHSATRLLSAALAVLLVADVFYGNGIANGTYHSGIWYDGLWMLSYVLLGAAALQPARREADDARRVGEYHGIQPKQIVLITAALFGTYAWRQYTGGDDFHVPHVAVAVGALIFFTAMIRMASQTRIAFDNEVKYQSLLEHASDAILVSEHGHVSEANLSASELTGYAREELIGLPVTALQERDRIGPLNLTSDDKDETGIGRRSLLRKDGRVVSVETSMRAMSDGRLLAIVRDVTERTKLERSLFQARKMEAVGQLAGGIAHDFNNLLSVIRAYTQFVLDDLDEADTRKSDLGEVLKASNRAGVLVRELLTFSRIDESRTEILDVNEVVEDMSGLIRQTLPKEIDIVLDLKGAPNHVEMDRTKLEQVILNLVVNAKEALPSGGRLKIETSRSLLDENKAELLRTAPGEFVLLVVSDDGNGISADVGDHVFEPFFTTKPPGSGSGLGLASVYGIVQDIHGAIVLQSAPGDGTTFRIYLPRAPLPVPETAESPIQAGEQQRTVMVVDDEAAIQRIAERVLRSKGFEVLSPTSPEEALLLAAQEEVAIDLVITDVVMPRISGGELVDRIRETRPDVPVIFISGFTRGIMSEHDFAPGDIHLAKPFMPAALVEAVTSALASTASSAGDAHPATPAIVA